jgi:membrane-bound ClpP family serine protease
VRAALFLTALFGVPALLGFFLQSPVRRGAALAAAALAVGLYVRGVNVHGLSAWIFLLCVGVVGGFLLAELATGAARLISAHRLRMRADG